MADYLIQGGTLQQIANAIRTKGGASGLMNAAEMPNNILAIPTSSSQTQEKTVDPALTQVEVTPDQGYTLSKVTVNAMPQAEQAVPTLENNGGTITATAVQTAGYVAAGTKTGTLELDKQAATEYNPSLADQTIPADKYLTGAQTIKAVTGTNLQALDADFVAENIKNGVDLFGIIGTFAGGATPPSGYSKMEVGSVELNVNGGYVTFELQDSSMQIRGFYAFKTSLPASTNDAGAFFAVPYSQSQMKRYVYRESGQQGGPINYPTGSITFSGDTGKTAIGTYVYFAIGN